MNMQDHDDEFDLRISKRERLLPQFDAELDGPDADTDRVLLARARSASHPVQLRTPAAKTFRAPRWAVPVGLAATLVLSFTLLLHTSPPQVAAPASAPMASQAVSESAMSDMPLSESTVSAASAGASAPAPAPERSAAPTEPAAAVADRAFDAMPAEVKIEPSIAVRAMPVSPAPAPPPPAMAAEMSANVAGSADLARSTRGAPAESVADAAKERAESAPLDPDAWLRRIEQLRNRGLDAEARRELLAFRQQFPDRPLPAALQSLLPAP